jgi:lysyl-tRNA synthetase class 1
MHWTDELAQQLAAYPMPPAGSAAPHGVHVINDSKTPSGRAHVGSLRGVLIHDAVFRALKAKGIRVVYRFGCDDYDPVDELPHGMKEHYAQFLGQPLCNTPAPPGSKATDMADYFISDFWSVFKDLGVGGESGCEFYRMRDVYRSGQFNEAIDRILQASDTVRAIYKDVSGSDRPKGWVPFQAICEKCGRIGTVECFNYDASRREIEYHCRPDLVTWAKGCNHRGKVSVLDGKGKLPWKLEWVAKWATFPVTIEGAGEDHNTKGGSRDVAAHCLKAIYGREAPMNIPYGFILIGGRKMSSSKGLGVTAREMADFLPPEILRYLMIRTKPKSQANFEPTEEALVKLFNEFDRAHAKSFADPKFPVAEKTSYLLSVVDDADPAQSGPFFECEFQLVLALVQMPHLDIFEQFERIKGSPLTGLERAHLDRRVHAARFFIANLALPEERLTLQTSPPPGTAALTSVQRAFCRTLAERLKEADWNGEALQAAVFDAARLTPIDQPTAFQGFYRVLLDNTKGPKAGNFLAFLQRDAVVALFAGVPWNAPVDEPDWLLSTAGSLEDLRTFLSTGKPTPPTPVHAAVHARPAGQHAVIEAHMVMADGKQHMRRVRVEPGRSPADAEKAVRGLLPSQIA